MLFTVLGWFLAFWSSINLLDYALRTYHLRSYENFVERYELSISLFQIRFVPFRSPWKVLKAVGQNGIFSKLLTIWFTIGVVSAICCSLGTIFYLSKVFVAEISSWWFEHFYSFAPDGSVMNVVHQRDVTTTGRQLTDEKGLEGLHFVIPGWNIPWIQVPLYIGILLVAAVVHEMGHMLAALSSSVPVSSLGLVIFVVYLGAYVEIDNAALLRSSSLQKLGISCAGVWHNLVLASFALMLYEATPAIVSPFYISGAGVFVEGVQKGSPLSVPVGLQKGDVIHAISGCNVSSTNDWNFCLKNLKHANPGYCVPDEMIAENIANEMRLVENELDCCYNSTWNSSGSHMCFYMRDWVNTFSEPTKGNQELLEYFSATACSCLSARYVAELQSCKTSEDCRISNSTVTASYASCVFPALLGNMSFMRISIRNESRVVLYVGYVKELEVYVRVSNFVPRAPLSSTVLPHIIELVARYLFTFSFAFAVINAMPCIYLDGQHLCSNLVDFIFSKWRPRRRRLLKRVILVYGTTILMGNIILAISKFYKYTV